jgi:hypothetical protein
VIFGTAELLKTAGSAAVPVEVRRAAVLMLMELRMPAAVHHRDDRTSAETVKAAADKVVRALASFVLEASDLRHPARDALQLLVTDGTLHNLQPTIPPPRRAARPRSLSLPRRIAALHPIFCRMRLDHP